MIKAYLDYPTSWISAHVDPACPEIQKMNKAGQRYVRVDQKTLSGELDNFEAKHHTFDSTQSRNDMWIEIDFADLAFETAVLNRIHRLVGQHYKPFLSTRVEWHCP